MAKNKRKFLSHIRSFLFSYTSYHFYKTSGMPHDVLRPTVPLEIREGDLEDIKLLQNLFPNIKDRISARGKYFFQNQGKLFLGFSSGQLVCFCWMFYGPGLRDKSISANIKRDEAYISSCYTRPDYRGKNIYPTALQYLSTQSIKDGKKSCFVCTASNNIASIRGIQKAGFSFFEKKNTLKLIGHVFNAAWSSPRAKKKTR